jgi:hypothetical protein
VGRPLRCSTPSPKAPPSPCPSLGSTSPAPSRPGSLALRDQRGLEADELSFDLDDADGLLAIPPKGAEVRLALGWPGALVQKGVYYVESVRHSGPPDRVAVSALSADLGEKAKTAKERSFDNTTLGAVLTTIAGELGLTHLCQPCPTCRVFSMSWSFRAAGLGSTFEKPRREDR